MSLEKKLSAAEVGEAADPKNPCGNCYYAGECYGCKHYRDEEYREEVAEVEYKVEKESWNTKELQEDFEVIGFQAPYVVVVRKSDGQKGSLKFFHNPLVYYGFHPYNE